MIQITRNSIILSLLLFAPAAWAQNCTPSGSEIFQNYAVLLSNGQITCTSSTLLWKTARFPRLDSIRKEPIRSPDFSPGSGRVKGGATGLGEVLVYDWKNDVTVTLTKGRVYPELSIH
jgi:hypothetical protein